jgi:signal peptidase I
MADDDALDLERPVAGEADAVAAPEAAADPDATPSAQQRPANHLSKTIREWAIVVVVAITAAILMKVFVVQQFYVSGHSMDTTLHDFDRVLVNKLSYDLHDPRRGDVVVLEDSHGFDKRDLIKRVIALPGETIEIRQCVVYIDGKRLVEPYLDPDVVTPTNCGPDYGPAKMGDDKVFVMGDNRGGSGDSRNSLGPVDYDQIVGRAFVVIWPKGHWRWL